MILNDAPLMVNLTDLSHDEDDASEEELLPGSLSKTKRKRIDISYAYSSPEFTPGHQRYIYQSIRI